MSKPLAWALILSMAAAVGGRVEAQDERLYAEGPVTQVGYIRTRPGMYDAFMKWVATERRALMDAQVRAGIILEYHVYAVEPRTPQDPDIILTITYRNMAAFDGLQERVQALIGEMRAAARPVAGAAPAVAPAPARDQMRTVLGSELIRELVMK